MNIWIEPGALRGPEDRLLRSGVMYALTRLQQMGHRTGFEEQQLSGEQQRLIRNEPLETGTFEPGDADMTVTEEDGRLLVSGSGGGSRLAENWVEAARVICFPVRTAEVHRNTAETDISAEVSLDGKGLAEISTGLGFLDHMLEQIAKHGLIDLRLRASGDLEVDEHHTIEDVGIVLGTVLDKALGDKTGIRRYGFVMPMDESRALVSLDLSGRPYLAFEGTFNREKVGDFPTEMAEHFFYSLAINLKATLHIQVEGKNDHHQLEACFKGFARALRGAISRSERNLDILPSTKNLL